ncbi:MAG: hypothetical protein WC749_05265 [Dehalococcoidia bacterium]
MNPMFINQPSGSRLGFHMGNEATEAEQAVFANPRLSLGEILSNLEVPEIADWQYVESIPVGLESCWAELSEWWKCSLSEIQAITVCHGLAIILSHDRVQRLVTLSRNRIHAAKLSNDAQAMRLFEEDEAESFEFVNSTGEMNLGCAKGTYSVLKAASLPLGLEEEALLLFACIESVLTLNDEHWRIFFEEDSRTFWRHIDQRLARLGRPVQ